MEFECFLILLKADISLNNLLLYKLTNSFEFLVGGETIRDINRISGAFVELDRNVGPNPNERIFKVVGNPDQIQHAVRLMTEKANLVSEFWQVLLN